KKPDEVKEVFANRDGRAIFADGQYADDEISQTPSLTMSMRAKDRNLTGVIKVENIGKDIVGGKLKTSSSLLKLDDEKFYFIPPKHVKTFHLRCKKIFGIGN
ncbi:hypothetical protein PFISCL1PPCAC_17795, partial [Pristionchus fissidentatus]